MTEKPLYLPCVAAHSPQRLEIAAASRIASQLVARSVPGIIAKAPYRYSSRYWGELCRLNLDEILLGSSEAHDSFKKQFRAVKSWWEKTTWFGPVGSPLRNLVQERVSYLLDHLDYHSLCPVFAFTCQLCYSKRAGVHCQNGIDVIVNVEKRRCDQYATFLESLGLYQVEHLSHSYMIFGNPKPLVSIVKNAPHLRSISLRYNSCDYVMSHVGMFCPRLERLVVEDFFGKLCVSEKYLYKTFFCGLSKREVAGCDLTPPELSFPNLTHADVGRGRISHEFIIYLNYYYPHVRSLSCNSFSLCASDLLTAERATSKSTAFKIEDICLTSECVVNLEEDVFFKCFPNVMHITLTLDYLPKNKLVIFERRAAPLLSGRLSSLTVHLPFDSFSDEDVREVVVPMLQGIGSNIKKLQIFLFRRTEVQLISDLINSFSDLKLLTLRCCNSELVWKSPLNGAKLKPLSHLKALSLILLEETEEDVNSSAYFSAVSELLSVARDISSLELVLPGSARDWLVSSVAKGAFNHVTDFILNLHSACDEIDVDFYVVLVEAMTALKHLFLIGTSPTVLTHLKQLFATAQLRITSRKRELSIAYHGLHSKFYLT